MLDEKKLCPKGRAYYNRRIAAGEKPSAYLSGRAVKVCKGLMKEDEDNFRGIDPSEAYNDVDAIDTASTTGLSPVATSGAHTAIATDIVALRLCPSI